ncbi:MAG: PQQ-dependent sugar dehydrogenase [Bacteroidota bacterium]
MRRLVFLLPLLVFAPIASSQMLFTPPAQKSAASPGLPSGFYLEDAVDARFTVPVAVAFAPGNRMFVLEKSGIVKVVVNGTLQSTPFLDLRDEVLNQGDRGLLGIAIDPDFETNRRVFFSLTVDHNATSDAQRQDAYARVVSYQGQAGNPNVADLSSRRVLIGETFRTGIPSCYFSHSIGTLKFGADGTLLVGTGDGAHYSRVDEGGLYPQCFGSDKLPASEDIGSYRSQRVESLAGKILRVDPETGRGLPSNPFYTGDADDTASKVWALGLRNPYRFSIGDDGSANPADGRPGTLYIGDVGWTRFEDFHVAQGGENFGWPCYEGPAQEPRYFNLNPATNGCNQNNAGTISQGIFWWGRNNNSQSNPPTRRGRTIVAGDVYLGDRYPAQYTGRVFYGDYSFGWTASADLNGNGIPVNDATFGTATGTMVNYTYDPLSRYLYMVDVWNGRIKRLRHNGEDANAAPVARATASPENGGVGLQVQLSPSGSFDPDGDALSYSWDLGDGRTSVERAPLVTYGASGDYTVVLTVSDGLDTRQATVPVKVRAGTAPTIRIAEATRNARPRVGEPVDLIAEVSDPDQNNNSLAVQWTITQIHENHSHPDIFVGSGRTDTFTPFEHGLPGETVYYRVRAEVRDDRGLSSVAETVLFTGPGVSARDVTADATPIAGVNVPNLGRLVDGVEPASGTTSGAFQVRTNSGDPDRTEDWIGLEFSETKTLSGLRFVEGRHEANGGWFEALDVQVRRGGNWASVTALQSAPAYRANDGQNYDAYEMSFAPISADAIRIIGPPAGVGGYVSAAELRAFALVEPFGPLPSGWSSRDVGNVDAAGQAGWADGVFTVEGSGDVWGSRDRFHLVQRSLPVGGVITARVAELHGENEWSKAGLVVRESAAAGARYLGLLVSFRGTHLQYRSSTNAESNGPIDRWNETAPRWLRIARLSSGIVAYVSDDGDSWTEVGREPLSLGSNAIAGLAVSAADYGAGELAWASFDNVSTSTPDPGTWAATDIGDPAGNGSLSFDGDALVVTGGGDVWGDRDNFHFVSRTLDGDGTVIARVASLTGSSDWIKGGLVIRASSAPGAPYAGVFVSKLGTHFQFRTAANGPSAGPVDLWGDTAPRWIRLDRSGTTVAAFVSSDGQSWSPVGTADVAALQGALPAGLAVSAADYGQGATATARFEDADVISSVSGVAPPNDATAAKTVGFQIDRVFPNPARGSFTLRATTAEAGDLTVEVIDALGRVVATQEVRAPLGVADVTFDARSFTPGPYLVRVFDETTGESAISRLTILR